ncbi:Pyridoxal biosynthesis protein PDX1.3 [Platanthera zijinensis]|uniref:Pyridoxal biosynthesis protein PDX1.3 n=1 Tax=Platanthera zijinensis TaxID=2320716 RepID=A0AAP0BVH4_9ASPA
MDESSVVTVCDNGTTLTEPPKKMMMFSVKVDLAGMHHPDASRRHYHASQSRIVEDSCAVMDLESVPAEIRAQGIVGTLKLCNPLLP